MNAVESQARRFIEEHVAEVSPLLTRSNLAAWEAAVSGDEDALRTSAEARTAVKQVYSRRSEFQQVRRLLRSGDVSDPLLYRQLEILEHSYAVNQLAPEKIKELTDRESELEGIFYNFRGKLDGRSASNNELREMLCAEQETERRRRIWEASKAIGPNVAPKLLELVHRRNEAARELGYRDYYAMEMKHQEIDESELFALLDDFAERSDEAFRELRQKLDEELSAKHGLTPEELRPWHWEDFFSQEPPGSEKIDLNPIFADLDLEAVAREYFASIGLPVEDVLARSDLYEREGKDQHAFCTAIDREGDVRMLCNLRPDERWMKTLLHEMGHAVYDKFLPMSLPWLLRTPAHTLSTESIAMFFGRLTRDPEWLRDTLDVHLDPDSVAAVHEQQRLSMMIAARWMLVMVYFERELYSSPDRHDLNSFWWDLVERYQLIHRPDDRDEPDWATKIHLSLAPVYYHNYLLGELMASQLTHTVGTKGIEPGRYGHFLRDRIFERGASLQWNDLLQEATGEPLSARYFVGQFVGEPTHGGTQEMVSG